MSRIRLQSAFRTALLPDLLPGPLEVEEPSLEPRPGGPDDAAGFRVILYDDDWHSQEEVVYQLQKATGYDLERCVRIMLETHTKGRAICYRGGRDECHRVARVLREIRLQCEVDCD